jgi:putative DNA primase/helicase
MSGATDALEVARLAALPPLDYDREREAAAKRLCCRVGTLDAAVSAARGGTAGTGNGQGRALDLFVPQPWPRPVIGAMLLGCIARAVRRHVVLGRPEADVSRALGARCARVRCLAVFPSVIHDGA